MLHAEEWQKDFLQLKHDVSLKVENIVGTVKTLWLITHSVFFLT